MPRERRLTSYTITEKDGRFGRWVAVTVVLLFGLVVAVLSIGVLVVLREGTGEFLFWSLGAVWVALLGGWIVASFAGGRAPPLLRIDRAGVSFGGRHIRWSQIEGVTIIVDAPVDRQGVPPIGRQAIDAAVVDFERSVGRVPYAGRSEYAWLARRESVVAVALRAGSGAQRRELTWHLAQLRGSAVSADRIVSTIRTLTEWQDEWASVPQPLGMHTRVRRRDLDPQRLERVLRAVAPGCRLTRSPATRPEVLVTPHAVAEYLARIGRPYDT